MKTVICKTCSHSFVENHPTAVIAYCPSCGRLTPVNERSNEKLER